MRLGIISDTHGHVDLTRPAIRMLENMEVEQVLHCGDIGSAAIVAMFAGWPTHFVFGNCDDNRDALRQAIEAVGQSCHSEFGEIELAGRRIALLHSDDRRRFQQTLHSGEWDLVCYGHTHVASLDWYGETLALNPGAIYRAQPHSLAVVELSSLDAMIVPL